MTGFCMGGKGRWPLVRPIHGIHDEVMAAKEHERLSMAVRGFAWLGARKLDRWVRQTPGSNDAAKVDAEGRYRTLVEQVAWPPSPVLRWHLAGYLLPGVALYGALQAMDWPTARAASAIAKALESDTQPRRRRFERRGRRRGFFTVFSMMIRILTRLVYPSPAWKVEWLETSRQRIALDITGCFYLDTLTELGARDLTPLYCKVDDVLYEGVSPELAWRRTTMLSTGGRLCDFRFERVARRDRSL